MRAPVVAEMDYWKPKINFLRLSNWTIFFSHSNKDNFDVLSGFHGSCESLGAFLWCDLDQDQWSKITRIMVHQRSRWIRDQSGLIGFFDVPWSVWSWISDPDHFKGTHPLVVVRVPVFFLLLTRATRSTGSKKTTKTCGDREPREPGNNKRTVSRKP